MIDLIETELDKLTNEALIRYSGGQTRYHVKVLKERLLKEIETNERLINVLNDIYNATNNSIERFRLERDSKIMRKRRSKK